MEFLNATVEDASEIMKLINEAYSIELGDSGVACKKVPRLLDAMEPSMRDAYAEERIIKCVHRKSEEDDSKHIAGMIEWKLKDDVIYFGPFAVRKEYSGKGVGRALVAKVESIGREKGATRMEIFILNHRSDLIPLYEKWGFVNTGRTVEYPYPDRLTRPTWFLVYTRPIIPN